MSTRSRTKSTVRHSIVRAKLKLTNTKSTLEPDEICEAKSSLKSTKNVTLGFEEIANSLHQAQKRRAQLTKSLSDQLTKINIANKYDKFGIFANNMGRVHQNLEEIDQMYLMNMNDELMEPLKTFNATHIKQCQSLKIKLKAVKGEYDINKKKEDKLLSNTKSVNLSRMHSLQTKSAAKLDELSLIRSDFLKNVDKMDRSKLCLLASIKSFMESFKSYSKIHCVNLKMQQNMMSTMPPPIKIGTNEIENEGMHSSDTEDCIVNDYGILDENASTFNDFGLNAVIIKQGKFKKRGKVNKGFKERWFKLFGNKKLCYFELNEAENGSNGILKGYVNLIEIESLNCIKTDIVQIETKNRKWTFQFCSIEDRDSWYICFHETCINNKTVTIAQTAKVFDAMYNNMFQTQTQTQSKMMIHRQTDSTITVMTKCPSINDMDTQRYFLYNLQFVYAPKIRQCMIENNGVNVQISVDYRAKHQCLFAFNDCFYALTRFNFYYKRHQMEMHFVHTNEHQQIIILCFIFSTKEKYTKPKLEWNKSKKRLVLATNPRRRRAMRIMNVPTFTDESGTETEDDETETETESDFSSILGVRDEQNDFLQQFWDKLPLKNGSKVLLNRSISFDYLFQTAGDNYVKIVASNEVRIDIEMMRYSETEGVQWFVAKKQHFISFEQMNALARCW